jgi:polyhydroxyalkanoate synthesis repressor PhaR
VDSESRSEETVAPRVIKRYANRKLYDTRDSRYVTLQQIAEFVRSGEDVQIIDNNTKENLTHVTLAQIIYEEEKKGEATGKSSIGTLRQFIQQGGERLMTTLREGPVGKLIRRDSAPGEEEAAAATGGAPGTEETKKHGVLDELKSMADDRVRSLLSAALGQVHHLQSEVKRLQGRIDELESKLVQMSQRPSKDKD